MRRLVAVLLLLPAVGLAQEKKGTPYAFLVGCSTYPETELKPLPYAVNDVQQFRQALLDTGFRSENVRVMFDKAERPYQPEQRKIQKEFAALLAKVKPEDSVVVALSGHGVHFKGDPTGYFCPLDADLTDKGTLIPFEGKGGVFEQLKACKASRKLLIVNACRNDPANNRAQAAEKIDLDDADPEVVPEGIAAIYSCKAGQKSYFDPKRQAGIFFDHVTRAWQGEYAKDGKAPTIEDFFSEVVARTKRDAEARYGVTQVPEVKREYKEEWRVPTSEVGADFTAMETAYRTLGTTNAWFAATGPGRWEEWRRLAEEGNTKAMNLIARCYELGVGVEKDNTQAAALYRKAADLGDPRGITNLGLCYERGDGVEKDISAALLHYRKAAALGFPRAMTAIAICHANGLGVRKDDKEAGEWFSKAADMGDGRAMFNLGVLSAAGRGVDKDETKAAEWYRKSADAGDHRGVTNMAWCYETGFGVAQDQAAAIGLYKKGAELNNPIAMYNFGRCLEAGTGVPKDFEAAVALYKKAAALGHADAKELLKLLNQE